MLLAQLLHAAEQPLGVLQVGFAQLHEGVDKDGAHIEVLAEHAAEEAQEHFGGVNVIVAGVDKANLVVDVEHVAIIVVQEDHIVGGLLGSVIGHIDQTLGLAGALFACDDLNHGKPLLALSRLVHPLYPILPRDAIGKKRLPQRAGEKGKSILIHDTRSITHPARFVIQPEVESLSGDACSSCRRLSSSSLFMGARQRVSFPGRRGSNPHTAA